MDSEFHRERIECPECHILEMAYVEHTEPFWTYVHTCGNCGHVITESEWKTIDKGAIDDDWEDYQLK